MDAHLKDSPAAFARVGRAHREGKCFLFERIVSCIHDLLDRGKAVDEFLSEKCQALPQDFVALFVGKGMLVDCLEELKACAKAAAKIKAPASLLETTVCAELQDLATFIDRYEDDDECHGLSAQTVEDFIETWLEIGSCDDEKRKSFLDGLQRVIDMCFLSAYGFSRYFERMLFRHPEWSPAVDRFRSVEEVRAEHAAREAYYEEWQKKGHSPFHAMYRARKSLVEDIFICPWAFCIPSQCFCIVERYSRDVRTALLASTSVLAEVPDDPERGRPIVQVSSFITDGRRRLLAELEKYLERRAAVSRVEEAKNAWYSAQAILMEDHTTGFFSFRGMSESDVEKFMDEAEKGARLDWLHAKKHPSQVPAGFVLKASSDDGQGLSGIQLDELARNIGSGDCAHFMKESELLRAILNGCTASVRSEQEVQALHALVRSVRSKDAEEHRKTLEIVTGGDPQYRKKTRRARLSAGQRDLLEKAVGLVLSHGDITPHEAVRRFAEDARPQWRNQDSFRRALDRELKKRLGKDGR